MENQSILRKNACKVRLTLFAVLVIVLYGCGGERPCYDSSLSIMFVKYDSTEVDTLRVVKFVKGNPSGSSIDTTLITKRSNFYQITSDTIKVSPSPLQKILTADFDWKILVGRQQESHRVTDIAIENKTYRCGGIFSMDCPTCINNIQKYNYDGQPFEATPVKQYVTIRK